MILWNFKPCTLLCPLYTTLWFSFGRQIGRTVPSMNPQQFSSGAFFCITAVAMTSKLAWDSQGLSRVSRRGVYALYTYAIVVLKMFDNSNLVLPNNGDRSSSRLGYASRLRSTHRPSIRENFVRLGAWKDSGIRMAALSSFKPALSKRNACSHWLSDISSNLKTDWYFALSCIVDNSNKSSSSEIAPNVLKSSAILQRNQFNKN